MSLSNFDVVMQGLKKAQKPMYDQQFKLYCNIAFALLRDAIEAWDADNDYHNMTGNTRYSFIAGVYYKGSLKQVYTTWDVAQASPTAEKGDAPTAGFSFPGDRIWFYNGNRTMGETGDADPHGDHAGELTKGTVLRYKDGVKFQRAPKGGSGVVYAKDLLQEIAGETNKDGFDIIIGVGVPYAEFLENERKLNLLTNTRDLSKRIADEQIQSIPKLNIR